MKSVAGARESPGVDVAALVRVVNKGDAMQVVTCLKPCVAVWADTRLQLEPHDLCLLPPGIAQQLASEGKVRIEQKGDT